MLVGVRLGELLCHTHLNLSHSQRRGQTKGSGKGPSSGALGRRSAANLKNNRKHMWETGYREERLTCGAVRNQDPRTWIQPDPVGSHWHFLIRYIGAKVGAAALTGTISVLNSAAGNDPGSDRETERVRGKNDGCLCPTYGEVTLT